MTDTDPNGARKQPLVRFSPLIQVGQLIQAGVALFLGAIAVTVWGITSYMAFDGRITTEATNRGLLTLRVEQTERTAGEARDAARNFAAAIDSKLEKISGQISDLRAQAGSSSARR